MVSGPLGKCRTQLHLRDEVARHKFLDALKAFSCEPRDAHAQTVVLGGTEAIPSLVLRRCALPVNAMATTAKARVMLAFVVPLSGTENYGLSESLLASTLQTTPAETKLVLALWRQSSLKAAAQAMHVTVATARTQLKRVFGKTGIHSQNELMAIIERLMLAAMI